MNRKAVVVGGGIGGLTAGIALLAQGWEVEIWEAARKLLPVGAGLLLQPNAMNALARLGVSRDVEREGVSISEGAMCASTGQEIQKMDLLFGGRRRAAVGIHRARLQEVLLSHLEGAHVRLSKRVSPEQVQRFIESDEGFGRADVVVGADGVHSAVTRGLFGELKLRYAGYQCVRGVVASSHPRSSERLTEYMGRGRRFGVVPLGRGQTYWFATFNAPQQSNIIEASLKDSLRTRFAQFPDEVRGLVEETREEQMIQGGIADRRALTSWTRSRVCLLGDAAHPMTPNLGQGACQAIEDAVELADQLSPSSCTTRDAIFDALRRYEQVRLAPSSQVVIMSRRMGVLGQLESRLLRYLRDLMYRLTPTRVTEKRILELVG